MIERDQERETIKKEVKEMRYTCSGYTEQKFDTYLLKSSGTGKSSITIPDILLFVNNEAIVGVNTFSI